MPNSARRTREHLTPEEVDRLVAAAGRIGRHGHRDRTLILLAYRHGLRVSELVALRWEQVDLTQGLLHVSRLENGVPSTHPLRGPELRGLRRLQRESLASAYVFVTERRGPLTGPGPSRCGPVPARGVRDGAVESRSPHCPANRTPRRQGPATVSMVPSSRLAAAAPVISCRSSLYNTAKGPGPCSATARKLNDRREPTRHNQQSSYEARRSAALSYFCTVVREVSESSPARPLRDALQEDHGRLDRLCGDVGLYPAHGVANVGLGRDVVAQENGGGAVAADLHGNRLRHPARTMLRTAVRRRS